MLVWRRFDLQPNIRERNPVVKRDPTVRVLRSRYMEGVPAKCCVSPFILLLSYGCLSCCWRAGKLKWVQLAAPVPWMSWRWFIGLWGRLRDRLSCVTGITVYILQSCCVLNRRLWGCQNMTRKLTVTKAYFTNKGKPVPLQARKGPEGSKKLRFPDFMTTAQDGGKVVSLTQRPPLPPGNTPGTHFC